MASGELTPKQQRFVDEYLIDLNATQAATRAGYSERTANEQGSRLLAHVSVSAAIQARLAKSTQKAELTVELVDQELVRLIRSDLRRLFREDGSMLAPHEWPDDVAASVSGVDVTEEYEGTGESRKLVGHTKKVKIWDKVAALNLAAKRLRLLSDTSINLNFHDVPDAHVDARIQAVMRRCLPNAAPFIEGTATPVDAEEVNW